MKVWLLMLLIYVWLPAGRNESQASNRESPIAVCVSEFNHRGRVFSEEPGHVNAHSGPARSKALRSHTGIALGSFIVPNAPDPLRFLVFCTSVVVGGLWFLRALRSKMAMARIHMRLEAQLEERERIARELHDTLLQGFQGIVLRFQAVIKRIPEHDPARNMIEATLDRAEEVLLEGRERVRGLRETTTLSNELPERLTKCANELLEDYPADFRLSVVGTPETLNAIVIDEIYAIAREALRNAFVHSYASRIEIETTYSAQNFRLVVRDDGIGITADALQNPLTGHWGVAMMHERATKIGADLKMWTRSGVGTEIDLRVTSSIAYPIIRKPPSWVWLNPLVGRGA